MMNADEFRALQAPHKARYREDPASALQLLRAEGILSQENVSVRLVGEKGQVSVGLHPLAGGDGTFACSAERLLEALVGCAGVTLAAVATTLGVSVDGSRVAAEGQLDFRGTLGVDRNAPVGFSAIRLRFRFPDTVPWETRKKLVALSERYCVVLQTLSVKPELETEV